MYTRFDRHWFMHRILAALTAALVLTTAMPVVAQTSGASSDPARAEPSLGIGVSAAKIGEDWWAQLGLSLLVRFPELTLAEDSDTFGGDVTGDLRLLFYAPLQFLIADRAPNDEDFFRDEAWDEPAEFMRILRVIEYGQPWGGVYWRGGELVNVRIGHRSIVDNYANSLDVDHFQWGLHVNTNTVYGGTETLIDNVANPDLIGSRFYVRPMAFVDRSSWWNRLAVGLSLFGDVDAPARLQTDAAGQYVPARDGGFRVERDLATGVLGFDAELAAVQTERVNVTPYTDVNTHLGRGAGWHLGVFNGFGLTDTVTLDLRAEYRLLGRNYVPTYFGPLYEIERWAYRALPGAPTRLPKLQWLRTGQENELRHGWLVESGLDVRRILRISAAWEDYTGPDNSTAWVRLEVPALDIVQFAAWYVNTRFDGAKEFFDLQNALAIAEARVMLTSWLYVTGQVNRRWQLDSDGQYEPVDDFAIGAGASFTF